MENNFLDGRRALLNIELIKENNEKRNYKLSQIKYNMESVNCKVCNGITSNLFIETNSGNLYECLSCGFIYAGERVTREVLYTLCESYIPSIVMEEVIAKQGELRVQNINAEIDYISSLIYATSINVGIVNILDVGCAIGDFLYYCKKKGWNVLGTDLSIYCQEIGRQVCEVDIILGELVDLPINPNSFDVITMRDSVEHLREPFTELLISKNLLKSGGLLYITTPELAKDKKILEERHMLPYHLNDFTKETLTLLLERVGFVDITYKDISVENDYRMRMTARKP